MFLLVEYFQCGISTFTSVKDLNHSSTMWTYHNWLGARTLKTLRRIAWRRLNDRPMGSTWCRLCLTRQRWTLMPRALRLPSTYASPAFGVFWSMLVTRLFSSSFDILHILMAQLSEFACVGRGFYDWFQSMMQFSAMSCQWTHSAKSVRQLWCIGADLDGQSRLLGVSDGWSHPVDVSNHQWKSVWPHVPAASRESIYTIWVGYWQLYYEVHIWTQQQEMQTHFVYDHQALYKASPDHNCWTLLSAVTQFSAEHQ